ncbi:MAG: hypothetical protein WD080_11775, partial [Egibacteraceae bacterium]
MTAELTAGLAAWIPAQRWFAGKARTVRSMRVADLIELTGGDGTQVLDALVDVAFADGHAERYQVPLAAPASGTPLALHVEGTGLADATAVPAAARLL